MQNWEAGVNYPTAEKLRSVMGALLEAGGLSPGRERDEAESLWTAAERESAYMHAPFDAAWFEGLLARGVNQLPLAQTLERREDWDEAPDTMDFVGRADELPVLVRWVRDERCRILAVLGMGGVGKTNLAARLAQDVAPSFERAYWRSLRNAPALSEWLAGAIALAGDQQLAPPLGELERDGTLLRLLRERRCLLVLDNFEAALEPGQPEGRYRADMEGYGRLLRAPGRSVAPELPDADQSRGAA